MERALKQAGHDVMVCGEGFAAYSEHAIQQCDAIFVLENYNFKIVPDLSKVRKLKLFWSIDGHCNFDAHYNFVQDHGIDVVLHSCAPCVGKLKAREQEIWFPNAYPRELFEAVKKPKRLHSVGYCGSYGSPKRTRWLDMLELKKDINVLGDNMVRALQSYQISFNMNLGFDINYRTFESCGAGAMLLTNRTPGLSRLFEVGLHIQVYDSYKDCLDKIEYYAAEAEERREIARAGYELVRDRHTYSRRAQELVAICSAM
jgi:hypothetical protein